MNKTLLYLLVIITACITLNMLIHQSNDEKMGKIIQQQDSVIQHNAIYRDSLVAALSKTQDSLDIAFTTIRQINAEKQQSLEYAQQVTRNMQRIQFQKMKSDQERDSTLHELYPTMK